MFCNTRFNLLVSMVLFLNFGASAQLAADFNIVIPSSNCNPAVYSFVNASTGTGLTYQWNFGVYPGVNSIFQNPSTTYLQCGTFQVKLVATDINGAKDSTIKTVNIRCSPKAQFSTSATTGCVPLATSFNSTSTAGSGNITNYVWDFGDGSIGSGNNPSHTYMVAGCKNVTLIVTNTYNCVNDTTLNNLLCAYPVPVSTFTATAQTACFAPLTTTYQLNTSSGTAPYSYQWIFQGGTPATSTLANPTVTYNASGSYTSILITTDAHGCADTLVKNNFISIASNIADFTLGANVLCSPANIVFSGVTSGNPLSWNWTASQPAALTGANTQNSNITFPDSGAYNVCLIINYPGGCLAQKCSTIVINPPPVANFSLNGPANACVPDAVTFTDSSSGNNLGYHWLFPGGVPASATTAVPPSISYSVCGYYSASLTVTDVAGCSNTLNKNNFLNLSCTNAIYTATPHSGCVPLTTTFNSTGSFGNPVAWYWNFNDPSSGAADTSSLQNPVHTFNNPGCYTVLLRTTNALGCTSTYYVDATVCCGYKPHANFSANPPMTCANKPVFFTDSSTNTYAYTTYKWNFHDAPPSPTESRLENPSYTYYDVGSYDVTLIVS
ncbi:MAG: hypothetical protein JWO06_1863, partial [Bacteroidota bacterium]|nr:hypothetical protein [Bacteroidota bacterium]